MRRIFPLLAPALLSLAVHAVGCGRADDLPAADPDRPDLVLVSIDTLRADHLGAWGYTRDTSPFLDALASRGLRFASAWAPAPWTLPSHSTLLSGLLPPRHGAVEGNLGIPVEIPLLSEVLRDAGYATGGVVSTLYVSRVYGFDRGFDFFEDFEIRDDAQNHAKLADADRVVALGLDWARRQASGRPLFLFLHLYDVHVPYAPGPPWDRKFDRPASPGDRRFESYEAHLESPLSSQDLAHQMAQYDEAIAYVDSVLGRLHETWTDARPNAVFAVVSDHGEEFGERGSWGHAHTLWPEQLRVPWIVAGAGVAPAERSDRVGLEDVAPTLAGLVGVPFPSVDGVDRLASVSAEPGAPYAETSRHDSLKLRWHADPFDLQLDLRAQRAGLCDLAQDPACISGASSSHPDVIERMRNELVSWLGEPWELREAGRVETDGVILMAGRPVGSTLIGAPGTRFAVQPIDAEVSFVGAARRHGPYSRAAGALPELGAPIAWHGRALTSPTVVLDPAHRERLEALGYAQ